MKLSVKLQDDELAKNLNPLITAKIPISILNNPFVTSISTKSLSSDLTLSLFSNFPSGPSLKLSYSPTSSATKSHFPPLSLSLKSGLGLFGSPDQSPLVFKAHFSISSHNNNPTFSLHFKPQFGNFALKKIAFSNPRDRNRTGSLKKPEFELNSDSGVGNENGNGVLLGGSSVWQDVKLEPVGNGNVNGNVNGVDGFSGSKESEAKSGVFTGVAVMARTVFPVSKKLSVNLRWGVNLPSELGGGGAKMPYLTLNKVVIESVGLEPENKAGEKNKNERVGGDGDSEMLRAMCLWMRRDLEAIGRENREIKRSLAEMKSLGISRENCLPKPKPNSVLSTPPKAATGDSSADFEGWKRKKNAKESNVKREENVKREAKKPSDLESELQRAIEAASAATAQ